MAVISRRLGKVIFTKPQGSTFDPTEDPDLGGLKDDTKSTSSSLSGQAALQRAALERQKYNNELAAAADTLTRQQQGATAQEAYLRGQLTAPIPSLVTGEIEKQEKTGQEYIQNQAAALLKQLQERQGQATALTQTGFSNLQNYLARNQPTAFAQAPRQQATPMTSDLMQYLAGQGVSGAPVQSQVDLANLAAQGGASNYNQLLNVLAAREQAGQGSRQAEAEMGLASQLANLQAIYGQGTASLEQQRLGALAQLAQQISAARLQAAQQKAARDQAIQDALAALYGTGYVKPPVQPSPAEETLSGIASGTTPPVGVDALLELIAQAQQSPTYSGGGGGGGGLPIGNAMVAF